MTPIQKQIQENFKQLEEMKKKLGIRPRMEVLQGGNMTSDTSFSLRELNKNILKQKS